MSSSIEKVDAPTRRLSHHTVTDLIHKDVKDVADIDSTTAKELFQTSSNTSGSTLVQLKQSLSLWSVLGIGFGLTNSWFGISASLITGISSGGPMIIVYGIIIIAFISYNIGITLSELSSAIPSAGGQYVWTRVLSPKKHSAFLAYICGSLAWAGAIFTTASMALALSQEVMGFWNLFHPDHVTKKWQLFVLYQLINFILGLANCHSYFLPIVGNSALYVSLTAFITITITVLVCSRGHYQNADFVFVEFNNGTGWKSSGVAFLIGLINPNWSFSCLDCATHLAEEVANPESIIPKAILGTVTIGFLTSFPYVISMFFCIRNLDDIMNSTTGLPILDIYYQALQSKGGALVLGLLVFATAVCCTISCHTWQARLTWSFARDNGLPFSKYLSQIHPTAKLPLWAHLFSSAIVAIVGALYLASDAVFNAMVVACISFLLLSYSVPVLCLLYRGRDNIKHGPFWLGKFGIFSNVVTVCWALFATVFFSLPSVMPVTAGNMNYVCAVFGVFTIWMFAYWYLPFRGFNAKAHFAGGRSGEGETEFPDVCLTDI